MFTIKCNTTDQMAHAIIGLATYVKEISEEFDQGDAPQVVYQALDFLSTVVTEE